MKKLLCTLLILAVCCSMALAEPYTFAVIGPMTGAAAIYGNAVEKGCRIAAEEINALAGEEVIRLIVADDTHDAEVALNAYNDALDNGAQAIIGTVTTNPCIAVSAQAYEDRVFMLTPSASSELVTQDKDNCFQLCFTDPAQGDLAARYIYENALGSRIGIIYNNGDAYSKGIVDSFEAGMKRYSLEIVAKEAFNDSTTDFSVQVATMKNSACDVVFLPIYYSPAAQIMIQARATEYQPLFFGVDGMDGILTLEGFDRSIADGVMVLVPFAADAQDEITVNFVNKYRQSFGETPNQFAADGYDCVYAMYQAFKQADIQPGSAPEEICDRLIAVFAGGMEFTGVTGSMTWKESGAVSKLPLAIVIREGAYVSPQF